MYEGFRRGLKQATTFRGLKGTTAPKLGQEPPRVDVVRAGRRHRGPEGSTTRRFIDLVWPALYTAGICIPAHHPVVEGSITFWGWAGRNPPGAVPWTYYLVFTMPWCLIAAIRAFTAEDTRRMRWIATAVNLLFPLYVAVYWLIR